MGILDKDHNDWPWFLRWVPRKWNAFFWGKPKKLFGNQQRTRKDAPSPVGEPGSWQISYHPGAPWWSAYGLYFAATLNNGWHGRVGTRWDDIDDYSVFISIAIRKFPKTESGDRDTTA